MFKSKINMLAISRGLPEVVAPMIPDEGKVFIFSDVIAVEPTITLNYIYCKMLDYFTFSGIGKKPFYEGSRFMINDPYLALAGSIPSLIPKFKTYLKEGVFDNWVEDSESVKSDKRIKGVRKMAKPASLGLAYGLGALPSRFNPNGGLLNTLRDAGYDISEDEAKSIYNTYWNVLYPELLNFKDGLAKEIRSKKPIFNLLGFKINPKKPTDAFNALIQSTVATLLDLIELELDSYLDSIGGEFMMRIHDEVVLQVPREQAEATCQKLHDIANEVSFHLGFKYPIRFDPKVAENFFEGK